MLTYAEEEESFAFRFLVPEALKGGGRIVLKKKKTRVCFGYRPVRLILKDVDLTLSMSSRVALVGPNGAGMQ
jgi:ATP-binding cassette subfamily F protein 3